MRKPIVSIIIPVFNREKLIKETLDSILSQTYTQWECIIVDDGSSDNTRGVVECVLHKDYRFRLYQRPSYKTKGANACRNYGFEKSCGKYIQWFDSDDLMRPNFLSTKVKALEEHQVDFVISKTLNFEDSNPDNIISRNERYYRFNKFKITNYNYVTQRINWLTYDFMGLRELVDRIEFNENLLSSQEYNFFCKLTGISTKVFLIDKYLTKRRVHLDSIRSSLKRNKSEYLKQRATVEFETWKDLRKIKNGNEDAVKFLYRRSVKNSLNINIAYKCSNLIKLAQEINQTSGNLASFLFLSYQLTGRIFHKGHFIRKLFLKKWE